MRKATPYCLVLLILVVVAACKQSEATEPQVTPSQQALTRTAVPSPTPVSPSPSQQPTVHLPQDEAPHSSATEWWYYTGHLKAQDGRRFGFELTFFQVIRPGIPRALMAHFAVTDQQTGKFHYEERAGLALDQQPPRGFRLSIESWSVSGAEGSDRLAAANSQYAIDLSLKATKPPVLHNGTGLVAFTADTTSYYYSRSRMEVTGTISVGGNTVAVEGLAWMDHQWGDFGPDQREGAGWDWFGLQMADGSDLMLSLLRGQDGEVDFRYGSFVDKGGNVRHLTAEDIEATPTRRWTSPRSGATYPVVWQVKIKPLGLELQVDPVMDDQEFDASRIAQVIYWEGEVAVNGTSDGRPASGEGYLEMTGYVPR
ncbi:MAG: carotenoid 1,2-hydratase [Chloroflexi bacterium]|nr:carotenoid 1,2-hydratase [Chloroflexota bacterium]